MKTLKIFLLTICFLSFTAAANAQTAEILAAANGRNYTVADLEPTTREIYENLDKYLADKKTELLGQQIAEILFAAEAAARKTTIDKMIEDELARRVPAPTDAQIKTVYDANSEQIGNQTLAAVKPQIVDFLQREPRSKALFAFVGELKIKHKVVTGKDVNHANLTATDVLATIDGKPITFESFNEKNGQAIYETKAAVYERARDYLENVVYSTLVSTEAKSLGIGAQDLIAREVSDKLKEFTEDERELVQEAFKNRLFQKYKARIFLKEPAPYVQKIAIAADDASKGAATAPVTIVMFTDFQCPACSAAHPVLQKVLAEYDGKVRLVVRNFPLVSIHQNAFRAAQAAAAANAQGKFFEYTELLYNNQNALDADSLKKYAAQIGLNRKQFDADLDGEKFAAKVRRDMADGESYSIGGTPTIFVSGVKMRNLSARDFREAIERSLKK